MRVLMPAIAAASVLFSSPLPADTHLAPGKPAGVKEAGVTSERREVLVITGVAIVSAGLAIVLIGNKSNGAATSTAP